MAEKPVHESVFCSLGDLVTLATLKIGLIYACVSFFVGWALARAMDSLLHAYLDPQVEQEQLCPGAFLEKGSPQSEEEMAQRRFEADTFRLMRVGWFTALALTVHNIPEGLLTYVSAQSANPTIGLGIAVAIGMHNIPEGFAVAFPIMIATGSKLKVQNRRRNSSRFV